MVLNYYLKSSILLKKNVMLVLASPKRSLKSTIFLTKNFTSELYLKMTLSYILSMCLNEKTKQT